MDLSVCVCVCVCDVQGVHRSFSFLLHSPLLCLPSTFFLLPLLLFQCTGTRRRYTGCGQRRVEEGKVWMAV